ncbi:ATP-binding protein [Thermofilum pendens]|uniref:ATPase n=1 Tax=Thermofilum pendens (strain DSM 2475 / Hrk 5) TaxID=368408 RepID=A1RZW1_THEPD|nr:ATP-binding protein [Thermofilum pendens]ABL78741.1 ATPase [Thermofilum pendens Hrk 5]
MSFYVRFVNRVKEIDSLRSWCSSQRATPIYLYGPEGCGKTRLLKEFVSRFEEFFGEDAIAIYIDALERESLSKAFLSSKSVRIATETLLSLVERFSGLAVGRALAESIVTLVEKALTKRKLEESYILIAVDDVAKAVGLDQIELYVKWLYEAMWKLYEEYKPRAINMAVTTSEGESLNLVLRHRHSYIALLWNLDKRGFEELFEELNPPSSIDFETVWRLLGGNPGKLVELKVTYGWSIDDMIKDATARLVSVAKEVRGRGLVEQVKLIIEDPDNIWHRASVEMGEAERILLRRNLIIYKGMPTIAREDVKPDKEIGIGEYYAWQIPSYREILKKILGV